MIRDSVEPHSELGCCFRGQSRSTTLDGNFVRQRLTPRAGRSSAERSRYSNFASRKSASVKSVTPSAPTRTKVTPTNSAPLRFAATKEMSLKLKATKKLLGKSAFRNFEFSIVPFIKKAPSIFAWVKLTLEIKM